MWAAKCNLRPSPRRGCFVAAWIRRLGVCFACFSAFSLRDRVLRMMRRLPSAHDGGTPRETHNRYSIRETRGGVRAEATLVSAWHACARGGGGALPPCSSGFSTIILFSAPDHNQQSWNVFIYFLMKNFKSSL